MEDVEDEDDVDDVDDACDVHSVKVFMIYALIFTMLSHHHKLFIFPSHMVITCGGGGRSVCSPLDSG